MARTKVPILSQIITFFTTEPLYAVRPILEHVRTVVRAREIDANPPQPRVPRKRSKRALDTGTDAIGTG